MDCTNHYGAIERTSGRFSILQIFEMIILSTPSSRDSKRFWIVLFPDVSHPAGGVLLHRGHNSYST